MTHPINAQYIVSVKGEEGERMQKAMAAEDLTISLSPVVRVCVCIYTYTHIQISVFF